jgi:nucleoside-diphosphate-sugar epimerase
MNVIITGGSGFVGQALARYLMRDSLPLQEDLGPISCLTLVDLRFEGPEVPRVRRLHGSMLDPALMGRAFESPVDLVFHLASIPGGTAEKHYELGREVNLDATVALLERSRDQTLACGKRPRFVFASSIAALGMPLPMQVDDTTPLAPTLSYGAQKLIGEILVADFDRRGWLEGRSVRLPGIVARPPEPTGQLSAFLSDLIRELAAGRAYTCPVAADSTTWLMSLPCSLQNLQRAATLTTELCGKSRAWTLPALRVSMRELVTAIVSVFGEDRRDHIRYESNPMLEANFGRYPPLSTPAADAAGFRHDGDVTTLVRRALAGVA